jgi:type II secretory pathway predicted ATPase ExeA
MNSAVQVEKLHLFPCLTHGHTSALEQLSRAFAETQPAAVLISENKSNASYLIDHFVDDIDSEVAAVRITKPSRDADAGMREVVQAFGLYTKDMSLAGLENALTSFLSDQKQRSRRTIICFEEVQDKARWVLYRVRRLVALETKGDFGLMVILSGRPGLNALLVKPAFDLIRSHAGRRIVPGPFTLNETRAYISREVEAAGFADIGQVFEFDAVTLIHEVCSGIHDSIDTLCCDCIQLTDEVDARRISTNLVKKADKLLRRGRVARHSPAGIGPMRVNGARFPEGRLIARRNGEVVREQALNHGHILIGRGALCDIAVDSPVVSRHHALVVDSLAGVGLVDLGSKNGTFVDGRRIERHVLQNGDLITVGDSTITYFAGDDRRG